LKEAEVTNFIRSGKRTRKHDTSRGARSGSKKYSASTALLGRLMVISILAHRAHPPPQEMTTVGGV